MGTAKTIYLENAMLNAVLRGVVYTSPTTIYVALFTSAPSESGGGVEVTGGSYARQAVTFSAASSGSTVSNVDVNFTSMPACTVTYIGLYDASTGGNLLYYAQLSVSQTLSSGDTYPFPAGNITVSEE